MRLPRFPVGVKANYFGRTFPYNWSHKKIFTETSEEFKIKVKSTTRRINKHNQHARKINIPHPNLKKEQDSNLKKKCQ